MDSTSWKLWMGGQGRMKGQGSVQGKPSIHLQVQWLNACKWLKLQGQKGHTKLETYKRAINCYACSANGHEKFRGRGTKPLPTPHPLLTCAHAHQNTAQLPKRSLGASVGEGSKWARKGRRECAHSPCTLTLLALPLVLRALPE